MKTPLCEFSFETILPHSCTLCWSTLLGLACLLSELAPAWATDTNGPQAVSAATLLSSAQIGVRFNEPLDPATATNAANYQLDNGATVTGAALRPDGSNVLLTASGYVLTNFTVTINNVLDLATNAIAPNSQVTVQALTMEARDFGGPTERGSSFSSLPGEVDMVAGGADIWNYPDSFHFLYELRDGDFDLRVRIARLDLKATYTFAGLHVREDLSLGARCLKAVLFPPTGANAYTLDYRSTTNGGGANLPRSSGVNMTNAWIRLKRQTNIFTAYRSTNGTDWTQYAQLTQTMANRLFVGLVANPVNNAAGQATTAWFRDFSEVTAGTTVPATMTDLQIKATTDSDAAYALNDFYQLVPSGSQVETQTVVVATNMSFSIQAQNKNTWARSVTLRATEDTNTGWVTTYTFGSTNVTAAILGAGGFTVTNLAALGTAVVNVEVALTGVLPVGATKTLTIQSYDDWVTNAVRDTVRAVAVSGGGAYPVPTNGLTLWLKADVGVVRDSQGRVSLWQDQSLSGFHVSQGSVGSQPVIVTNELNAGPVVRFTDDQLARSSVPGTNLFTNSAATIFIVQKQWASDPNTATLSWQSANDFRFIVYASYSDQIWWRFGHAADAGSYVVTNQPYNWDDTWHELTLRRNGTNAEIRVDAINLLDPRVSFFTRADDNSQAGTLQVGNDPWNTTFNGDIAEVLVYGTALSDPDRLAVESYLRGRWGLTNAPAAVPDLLIKKASDPTNTFAADNVYQLDPAGSQIVTQSVAALGTTAFNVLVQNDGPQTEPVVLRATESAASGWAVSYRIGSSNITSQIVSTAGFTTTNLPTSNSLVVTVEITMTGVAQPGAVKTVTVRAYDDYVTNLVRDVVQAVAVATPGVQPDLTVRRDIDPSPVGDNIYNTTGFAQTKWLDVLTNQTAVYNVTLANDGNTNAAVQVSGTASSNGWTVKYWDYRLSFDGSDDYVDLGAWAPGVQWTVEAWVKFANTNYSGRRTIAGGAGDGRDWGITFHDGQLGVVTKPADCSSTVTYRSGPLSQTNVWYHLAGTCNGTNATLFLNGVPITNGLVCVNYTGTTIGARIGGEACCSGNNFPGFIRDVRIWNRPLSSNEIQTAMTNALTGAETGLVGYWPLDDGPGGMARDLSSARRFGTLANGPAWQRNDVTVPITGAGSGPFVTTMWPGDTKPLIAEVTPDATVSNGAAKEILLTATALADPGKADAVKMITTAFIPSTTPVSALYTTTADFEKGWFNGVEDWSTLDQLQLSSGSGVLPFLWVPNADDGTVSKVDTLSGKELARYRVCPPSVTGSPSRTTVDLRGNCWVANRQCATVVKIGLSDHGEYIDRNGDGVIQTSRDTNSDGLITGSEILAWGQDECVLYEVFLVPGSETNGVPGTFLGTYANNYWNPGPRGMAVDAQGNLWAGTHDTMKYYYIEGSSGRILRTIDVSPSNHTAYGAVIDRRGVLWSSGYTESSPETLLRLNTTDGSYSRTILGFHPYGIALDRNDHLFVSAHQEALLTRWNTLSGTMDWSVSIGALGRGVAVTDDSDVWVISSGAGTLTRFSNDGVQKSVIAIGSTPTGVALDSAGKLWTMGTGDTYLRRINPNTDTIDLVKSIAGSHYGYSDMTGVGSRNSTTRLGIWSVVHDAQVPNTAWQSLVWNSSDPTDTNILVRVRSSNDRAKWSDWETAANSAPLLLTPPGRYLEIEVTLRGLPGVAAPILYDISAGGAAPGPTDLGIALSASPNPVLNQHATTYSITLTNAGTNWASGIIVSNPLPTSFDVISVSVPGGSYQLTSNLLVCSVGGLAPQRSTTIDLVIVPQTTGLFTNTAWLVANETDPVLSNNTNTFVLTVPPTVCVAPVSSLVAWWPGESNANDLVALHHGTPQGGVFYSAAKTGKGFTFDSDDDRVTIPHSADLNPYAPGFTAHFWMKGTKSQPQTYCALVEKSHGFADSTGWAFHAMPQSSGVATFVIGAGGSGTANFPGLTAYVDVLDGRWHHLAATWDGLTVRFYVDAVLYGTTNVPLPALNDRTLNLAYAWGNGSPQRFFRGQLDEIQICNRALSDVDIAALYEARAAGVCQSAPIIGAPIVLPDGVVGTAFPTQQITAALGAPPYIKYEVQSGVLPPGLNLGLNLGQISGVPTTPGSYAFTVQVTDSASQTCQRAYSNTIFACTTPPAGMVAWWPGESNALSLVGTNHGTMQGGVFCSAAVAGKGFTFDSDDDRVTVPHSDALNPTRSGFTVQFWMKGHKNQPGQESSLCALVEKSHGWTDYNGWAFQTWPASGLLNFNTGNGNGDPWPSVTSTVDVLDGRWHYIVGGWDGSAVRLWVDGVSQGSYPHVRPGLNTRPLNIGFAWGGGSPRRFFRGQIDEVTIHNRSLTDAEIAASCGARNAGICLTPFINQPAVFPDAAVNAPFAQQITAALGLPPFIRFDLVAGALPPGLNLNTGSGLVSDTPTTPGSYAFTIQATDTASQTCQRAYSNTVFACTPPAAGLVGWWPAEDNTDDIVSTNHGTREYQASFDTGKVGRAFVLDGNQDAVRLYGSSHSALDITNNQLSIDFWITVATTNPPGNIISCLVDKYWDGSANGYELILDHGNLVFQVATTSNASFGLTFTNFPLQRWVHVAGTYDGAVARIYLDGVERIAAPLKGNILHNNHDACIGNDNPAGSTAYALHGLIDEIEIYNRGLSASEVQAIFNANLAGKCVPTPADLLVKNAGEADADYLANNVYEEVPTAAQTKVQTVYPLVPAIYNVKIENDGPVSRSFVLRAAENPPTNWTTIYKLDGADVTSVMHSSTGLPTAVVAPGTSAVYTVEITPSFRVYGNNWQSAAVNVYADSRAVTILDSVQMLTQCLPSYQPDLSIRRETDVNFLGEGVTNTTGAGQTKSIEVDAGNTATYRVKLRNSGNVTNRFSLASTGSGGGWTLNYCGGWPYLDLNAASYVLVSNMPAVRPVSFTLEAWVNFSSIPGTDNHVFGKTLGGGGDDSYVVWYRDGQLRAYSSGGPTIAYTWSPTLGRWYHVAYTFDDTANTQVLYLDGQPVASSAKTVSVTYDTHPLLIGGDYNNEVPYGFFPGKLADARLWNLARTQAELQANLNHRLNGTEPGLVGYWRFDEGSGTQTVDLTANANTGFLINGPVWGLPTLPPTTCLDITTEMTGVGWTNLLLAPAATYEFTLTVTPNGDAPSGSSNEVLVTASSLGGVSPPDAVKAITTVSPTSSVPVGATYTTRDDFANNYQETGVDYSTVPGQIQLATNSAALPYLWVPNSEGTISKVDTRTGRELARYRTGPAGVNSQPSRTTVDLQGNCWVANRFSGTVVKVGLLENGQFIDRNTNGVADTSRDLNNDGDITGSELLDWGKDECVLFEVMLSPGTEATYVPGTYPGSYYNDWGTPGVRGVAVDRDGNCWVGTLESKKFYYINGTTGHILRTIDVSSVNHRTYGSVLDRNGIVWSASHDRNEVLRLDPATGLYTVIPLGHFSYGINADRNNHVFVSGWQDTRLSRLNTLTATKEWTITGSYESRGIAITDDGDVWVANSSPGTVTRWSSDGALKNTIAAGNQPTGVAVDHEGKIWALGRGDEYIRRIDPATDAVILTKRIICASTTDGGYHYGYSDMTGIVARNTTTRIGTWTVRHNSRVLNTPWGAVSWTSTEPSGTSLRVRARSSNDQQTWSNWEFATNGIPFLSMPLGKYLEVEVTLQSGATNATPVLYDLTIHPAQQAGGWVAMGDYTGPARNGSGSRPVTFKATGGNGAVLKTWTPSLNFTPDTNGASAASFTLTNAPPLATYLSAKTAWHLRHRLPISFTNNFATASFTGPHTLVCGDLDASNLVDLADYYRLAASWYLPDAAADLDGSGLVDLDDYFIMSNHWLKDGDPE